MKNRKSPLSIKLIHWITSLSVIFFGLMIVLVLSFQIARFAGTNIGSPFLSFEMPVIVGGEKGVFHYKGRDVEIGFFDGKGKMALNMKDAPKELIDITSWSLLLIVLVAFYISWRFMKFTRNVKKAVIFEKSNIDNIRHVAYGLIIGWLVTVLYEWVLYNFIKDKVEFQQLKIIDDFEYNGGILLMALFIWVLSHIFIKGLEMKEEIDLTV
jgi:hypothetical protein